MSWFKSLCLTLFFAGCGFTPVYGPGGGETLQGAIRADNPTNEAAFEFVDALENRIGRSNSPRYQLSYSLSRSTSAQGITGSNSITRYRVSGSLTYRLMPLGEETILTQGTLENFTAYSASGSTLSTVAAQENAEKRLIQLLADQLVTRLMADPTLR